MEIVGNKDANYLCLTGDCIELGQAFNSCRQIEMHGFKQRKLVYQHRKMKQIHGYISIERRMYNIWYRMLIVCIIVPILWLLNVKISKNAQRLFNFL